MPRKPFCPRRQVGAALVILIGLPAAACRTMDPHRPFSDPDTVESERLRFESRVPARVEPRAVGGEVFFKVFRAAPADRTRRPLDVCVLQHGFGVMQALLNFRRLTYDTFVSTYYGGGTIQKLLGSVCASVFVPMQETNRTSILEMTERTEVFLREIACPDRKERALRCAFVGHSKGGAVAFSIARRCMQQRSLLGQKGCGRLAKIYSATGVIQGALGAFVAYGAALTRNSEHRKLIINALGWGMQLVFDAYDIYVPGKTNPIWLDLSPLAPMEDGLPLYLANDLALTKTGWLRADFSASAVDFRFKDDGSSALFGCGTSEDASPLNRHSCETFGVAVGRLHGADLRPSFEAGLRTMREAHHSAFMAGLSWQRYQESDGLADLTLALSSCRKGLSLAGPNRAVRSCAVFSDLNHLATAGGGPRAIADIILRLSE